MIIARPTVSEERWLVLALRYPALRSRVEEAAQGGPWKTTTWLARCLGFLLGLLAAGLFAGMLAPFHSPWLVGGLLMMAAAEWLVAQRRVIRSGVEEAVYLCGAVAMVVQILIWSRSGGHDDIGVALIAAAVLLVGWRLLNPLFTTLAAAGFSLAVAISRGSLFGGGMRELEAGVFCAALALAALIASGWQWRRPSHDRMLDGLVIVMPWLSYLWLAAWAGSFPTLRMQVALAAVLGCFVLYVIVGIVRRSHAPLISALGLLVCTAWALRRFVIWPLHWQLIAAGGVLLVAAILVDRLLRPRLDGLTSRPFEEAAGMDLLQVAAAAQMAPRPGDAPPAPVQGQGGEFGGGGASGRF
ncbi:MAG TPA: hypothetical protein VKO83_09110 [Steroidobacteraceae bacterium]|nr:hypothetical protein [Steroidobacteraceae bacterium]